MRRILFFLSIFLFLLSSSTIFAAKLKFTWQVQSLPDNIQGFLICKQTPDEQFKPIYYIADPTQREAIVNDPAPQNSVYGIKLVDSNYNTSAISPTATVKFPPKFPPIITDASYADGVLSISWDTITIPSDFKEYRIYINGSQAKTISDSAVKNTTVTNLQDQPNTVEVSIVNINDQENISYPYIFENTYNNLVPGHVDVQLISY